MENNHRRLPVQMENPFALKVGQEVFTLHRLWLCFSFSYRYWTSFKLRYSSLSLSHKMDFGRFFKPSGESPRSSVGNKPWEIPALQKQVMTATRGATDAFSGVGKQVNDSLRRLGAKNIEAGLAVKSRMVHRVQSCVGQTMVKMLMKFGVLPSFPIGQNIIPGSLQNSLSTIMETSMQNPTATIMQLAQKSQTHQGPSVEEIGSRTEKVISGFLQSPIFKEEGTEISESGGCLQSENDMLQMVLKHQKAIEELTKENEKIKQILVEDLKVAPNKLKDSDPGTTDSQNPSSDCFECRRKERKQR